MEDLFSAILDVLHFVKMAFDPSPPLYAVAAFRIVNIGKIMTSIGVRSAVKASYFNAGLSHLMCSTVLFCCLSCTFSLVFLSESRKRRWNWEL